MNDNDRHTPKHPREPDITRMLADASECAIAVHSRPASIGFDESHFRTIYRDATYFSCGRDWSDYEPAYRYGYATHAAYAGRRFDEVEDELAANWPTLQPDSRLLWMEARCAVLDAWRHIDKASPGATAYAAMCG